MQPVNFTPTRIFRGWAEIAWADGLDSGYVLAERSSHYFRARLTDQFDAVIHIDETRTLEPLERTARWDAGELPETYSHAG